MGFRVMVGLGVLMLVVGFWGAFLTWRKQVFGNRWFLRFAVAMGPSGFIAVLAGWMVTEVGRQPWVVYGVLRTRDAVAPVIASQVATSLLAYVTVYAIVFTAGAIYILRLMAEGPIAAHIEPEPRSPRSPGSPMARMPEEMPDDTPDDLRGDPS